MMIPFQTVLSRGDDRSRTVRPKIWKVRVVKAYPEAHNHLLIGQVVSRDPTLLEMFCRTFHFAGQVSGSQGVRSGPLEHRLIPWQRVEVINQLPDAFDFKNARLVVHDNEVFLTDGHETRTIVSKVDRRSY